MEKIKVDILIIGNLICNDKLQGGVKSTLAKVKN